MTPTVNLKAFDWRADYETGIPEVDREHRQLVQYIRELNLAMLEGKGSAVLQKTLDQLAAYTVSHFRTEELLMTRAKWPGLDAHRKMHHSLVGDVTALQANLRSGKLTITMETMTFLKRWLHTHILEEDMSFARYSKTLKA